MTRFFDTKNVSHSHEKNMEVGLSVCDEWPRKDDEYELRTLQETICKGSLFIIYSFVFICLFFLLLLGRVSHP